MADMARRREAVLVEDGSRFEMEVFAQATEEAPTLLCLPAMGVQVRYYEPFVRELHQRGLNVVACDLRGHGSSSVRVGRGTRFGYYEMVTRDWKALVQAVRQRFPRSPLYLLGHSLGGQLSALYLSRFGQDVQGLILVAACSVYYRSYGLAGGLKVLLGTQLAALIASAWGYFPGKQLKFAGTEAAGVMRDWARQARTGRYQPSGASEDFERLLEQVEHPVLAISVEGDTLAPPPAVEHLCQKMPRARLTRWHYSQDQAAGARIDHFRWVRSSGPVAERVKEWLAELREGQAPQAPRPPGRALEGVART